MNTLKPFTYLFLVLVLACQSENESIEEPDVESLRQQVKPTEVRTAPALIKPFEILINATGQLSAKQEVKLHFNSSGFLQQLNIQNGQQVLQGILLAALENGREQLSYKKALASYEAAKVNYDNDSIAYGSKLTELIRKNLALKNGVTSARLNLEEAQLNLNNTIITAPFSGLITGLEQKEGNLVSSGKELCTLYDPRQLLLTAKILESDYSKLRLGLKAEVFPLAYSDQIYDAFVTEISPSVDENGMIQVKLQVSKPQGLLPGMNANAVIRLPQNENVIVPREALVMKSGRPVVFTFEDGLAKWNYVEVGEDNGKELEIISGIDHGKEVIISNNLQLAHDARVAVSSLEQINP